MERGTNKDAPVVYVELESRFYGSDEFLRCFHDELVVLVAWIFQFRRAVTRWEYKSENFLGFVQLACLVILLRRL